MDDNAFMRYVLIGFCTLIVSASGCVTVVNVQDNNAIQGLVSHGANPLEARCAIRGDIEGSKSGCAILMSRR